MIQLVDPAIIKKTLLLLSEKVTRTFPHINRGGCCVFAVHVARRLTAHNIKVEIISPSVSIYGDPIQNACNLSVVRKYLLANNQSPLHMDNWEDEGVSFSHIAVRFKLNNRWYTYDSEKLTKSRTVFGTDQYVARNGSYTIEEAQSFADGHGWNKMFDRDNIPALHKLIDSYLA